MAYQAKRRKRFEEEFELVKEDGTVEHTLHVALDADDMIGKIYRQYANLTKALYETQEMSRKAKEKEVEAECLEKLGQAVVTLFESVFGDEDTGIIVDFYDGRYVEMCREVVPFIGQVVLPRIGEIKKENQKAALQSYNRRQRRAMFRK